MNPTEFMKQLRKFECVFRQDLDKFNDFADQLEDIDSPGKSSPAKDRNKRFEFDVYYILIFLLCLLWNFF